MTTARFTTNLRCNNVLSYWGLRLFLSILILTALNGSIQWEGSPILPLFLKHTQHKEAANTSGSHWIGVRHKLVLNKTWGALNLGPATGLMQVSIKWLFVLSHSANYREIHIFPRCSCGTHSRWYSHWLLPRVANEKKADEEASATGLLCVFPASIPSSLYSFFLYCFSEKKSQHNPRQPADDIDCHLYLFFYWTVSSHQILWNPMSVE